MHVPSLNTAIANVTHGSLGFYAVFKPEGRDPARAFTYKLRKFAQVLRLNSTEMDRAHVTKRFSCTEWLLRLNILYNGGSEMFIHEMTEAECRAALGHSTVGRLACARDDQPYVVPVHFAFDGGHVYGFTTFGQKVEWMRSNSLVCFEIDELLSDDQWVSVVIMGRYEELPDTPEHEAARMLAHELLQKRAVWWEPAYLSQDHRDQPHSLTPIFYRIRIEKMTGHRCSPNNVKRPPSAKTEAGFFGRILHRAQKVFTML